MGELRCAVVGAGMAGILSAIKFDEVGLSDYTVYEKADRLGGTWRENTYPGLSCDVPSHLYCYSFAPNPDWSHVYSPGPEIEAYFEDVARRYGVVERIRFGDEVVACTFTDGRWHLRTASGHEDTADVVIAATGVLHHPKYPDIEGLDTFSGRSFHSARWDHDAVLDGARVGVVGTGSTAIQIVSAIVDRVAELSLFQRTAQWVMPALNPPYSADEKAAFRRDPTLMEQVRQSTSDLFDHFSDGIIDQGSPEMAVIEQLCRENLENSVTDPDLRERLRPNYRAGCKRLILATGFYEAIQKANAELVTDAIERVEPAGVRTADGRLHELDVLVLATGFKVDSFVRPMEVVGRDGIALNDVWAKRPEAYLSISVPEFPNFFMLNGPNGPVGNFSLVEVAELQLAYILQLLEPLRRGEAVQVSAAAEALARWEDARVEASHNTIWSSGCRSWYLDDRGVPMVWPWPFSRFRSEMSAPKWEDYELRGERCPTAT
jgi:cation diffusion facilitator CzcD-associated flavoprotein CzcO